MKCDICHHSVGNNSTLLREHMARAHSNRCGKCGSGYPSTLLVTVDGGGRECLDKVGCETRRYSRGIRANAIVSDGEMAIWRNFYERVKEMNRQ